jgi:hypothetical protein
MHVQRRFWKSLVLNHIMANRQYRSDKSLGFSKAQFPALVFTDTKLDVE